MAVETAADRAVFVDPDDFGAVATFQPATGAALSVSGIFDAAASRAFADPMIATNAPQFVCASAGLPARAADGDMLTVDGATYHVRVIDHDGTGMALLTLEAAD